MTALFEFPKPGLHPRVAVLARVLAVALCPSVCPSVTSRCSVEMDERIDLVYGMDRSLFRPVLHCAIRKFRYLQK